MGFDYVASGPLVRSSYRAAELFMLKTLSVSSEATAGHLPAKDD